MGFKVYLREGFEFSSGGNFSTATFLDINSPKVANTDTLKKAKRLLEKMHSRLQFSIPEKQKKIRDLFPDLIENQEVKEVSNKDIIKKRNKDELTQEEIKIQIAEHEFMGSIILDIFSDEEYQELLNALYTILESKNTKDENICLVEGVSKFTKDKYGNSIEPCDEVILLGGYYCNFFLAKRT